MSRPRTVATHALSIFGDHSDVMHARTTGWAMLASASVQEAQDIALIAHAATARGCARVRSSASSTAFATSHEIASIVLVTTTIIRALVSEERSSRSARRALSPDAPLVRGTAQNSDAFFPGREAGNSSTGTRRHRRHESSGGVRAADRPRLRAGGYAGAPDAERVVHSWRQDRRGGADDGTLAAGGRTRGPARVRLYRPFPAEHLVAALPPTRYAPSPSSTGPRSPVRSGSRSTSTSWRPSPRTSTRRSHASSACHG